MSELLDNQAAFEAAKLGYGFAKLPSGHYLYEGVQVMFNDWLENNELRKAKAKITQLQAEVEALRKDAARYQWLSNYLISDETNEDGNIINARSPIQFDCVIDTAIAKDTQLTALSEMVKLSQEMGFYEPNIAG